jgi:hypothetical protein
MSQLPITKATIAILRLPIPIDKLSYFVDALIDSYGFGLTMQEEPKGWLQFNLPTK